jgi:hypothetical protein
MRNTRAQGNSTGDMEMSKSTHRLVRPQDGHQRSATTHEITAAPFLIAGTLSTGATAAC